MNVKCDKNISFKPKKLAFKLENSERILKYLVCFEIFFTENNS